MNIEYTNGILSISANQSTDNEVKNEPRPHHTPGT
ncbi:hypothetical protein ACFOU0_13930 [Salinicoccus sesuvii]|uniref:SHSP domain-containing protein n=1 Tax=Salinicoccus sesuvii TaxID=868281 RepID=A0ABV7NBQ8_9STAP